MKLEPYKKEFIEFMLKSGVLKFGEFTTKSGRQTPFFINTGEYKTGAQMNQLAHYYAAFAVARFPQQFTNLYGPAYKGIPLAATTAVQLFAEFSYPVSYTFNRKEAKDHGEGGNLIGNQYDSPEKILIIEDVVTAGTSVKESMKLLEHNPNAQVIGLLVSVDRMEKVDSGKGALQELEDLYGIKTEAIVSVIDIIFFLIDKQMIKKYDIPQGSLEKMISYRAKYGTSIKGIK